MKYKIAVIDKDEFYLKRLSQTFAENYADKIEVYSYTGLKVFQESVEVRKFDMLLIADGMADVNQLPTGVPLALLVEEKEINRVENLPAICKYQKHEILIKKILEICLEKENVHYTKKNVLGKVAKVLYVTAPTGGNGTTSIAAAVARVLANSEKKVLYMSLEKNAVTDLFFKAEADNNFTDVIYGLKSKKGNLIARIENIVQQDETGVYFFQACRSVFDMNELTVEDMKTLVQEICTLGSYDYIVIDGTLEYNDTGYFLCDFADDILIVTSEGTVGKEKLKRLKLAMKIWDQEHDTRLFSKVELLYNKTKEENVTQDTEMDFPIAGYIPEYGRLKEKQIIENMMCMSFFEKYI